jgi:lipoprotein-anchoring transpeptidase ErfK/SrfK
MRSNILRLCVGAVALSIAAHARASGTEIIISVPDQALALVSRGEVISRYRVSTSKFGIGDQPGSYRTPLGVMYVSSKIGDGLPVGAVIKSRMPTGEVLPPNAAGRDPIVSRVLWLRGKEVRNQNARERCIYIHGTAEENRIGKRASFGCVRMRSRDVIALYSRVHIGTRVTISDRRLDDLVPEEQPTLLARDY